MVQIVFAAFLVAALLVVAIYFMWVLYKQNKQLIARLAELETKYVVSVEDRLASLEQSVDELQMRRVYGEQDA